MFLHGKIVSTSQAMGHGTRDSASAVAQAFLLQWQESQATEGEPPKFIDGMPYFGPISCPIFGPKSC